MKVRAMFAFSALFSAANLQESFNQEIETQAKSGRIAHQLRALASNLDGLDIPESKKAFDAYSVRFNNSDKPKGLTIARAIAYSEAFAAIRSIFCLTELPRAAWAIAHENAQTKAKATRATNKRAEDKADKRRAAKVSAAADTEHTIPAITAADITAAISAGVFSEAELNAITAAARAMLPALV